MPLFDFKCEICGKNDTAYRSDKAPRFCSRGCMAAGMVGCSTKTQKYHIDDYAHERIKKLYQSNAPIGAVKELAKKLRLPRWKVSRYAQKQGWLRVTKKEPPWSEDEIRILKKHARHCEEVIQRHLKAAGYKRTAIAIVLKRRRLRLTSTNLNGYSATGLAMCLGVDGKFVLRAIKDGLLKASKRQTKRTQQQGGDIYWIKENAVKEFIRDNVARIDLAKVDKFWFVDLMAG